MTQALENITVMHKQLQLL